MKITTQKASEKEALKLYPNLIIADISALKKSKGKSKDRRNNISNVLKNLELVFTSLYLHHNDVSKEEVFERSIAERTKLRRERSDEIERKEQNINNELFKEYFNDYESPSNMYKKLSKKEGAVNEVRADLIKKVLTKLKRIIENTSKDNAFKIEEDEKIKDVVEEILEFDNKIQSGQGVKY